MTSDQIRLRSEILGTQVITRDTGKRLGVVSQLWVDIDRRELVALSLRDNILGIGGVPRNMLLERICQIGDVILVDDDSVLEDDVDIEAYSNLVNCEVITETGEPLGRVRGFKFDIEDGKLTSLVIASVGLPQIPDRIAGFETISTYELPIEEIVSSGPNRLIVFEGSEERLVQLTVGVMERLGIGRAPWEREEDEFAPPVAIRPENQLPKGEPLRAANPQPVRINKPVVEQEWDDDNWQAERPQPLRKMAQAQPVYEEELEDANWSEPPQRTFAQKAYPEPEAPRYDNRKYEDEEEDVWADDEAPKPYKAPKINIPEKKKAPEYEEEERY